MAVQDVKSKRSRLMTPTGLETEIKPEQFLMEHRKPEEIDSDSKHILKYSRIEGKMTTFYYESKIPNFWETYLLMFPMTVNADKIQPFKFRLESDKDKKYLNIFLAFDESIDTNFKCLYNVSLTHKPNIFSNLYDTQHSGKQILLYTIRIKKLSDERQLYVPNDTLTIYFACKQCFYVAESTMYTQISERKSYEKIRADASKMVLTENSLVSFKIGDQRLYANKHLICEKSEVFKAMLNSNMQEGINNEIKITDINYDILKLLLTYMEYDLLPNLDIENVETLSELLVAADYYDIKNLKLLCELQLIKLFNPNNVVQFLNISCLHNTTYLNSFIQEWSRTDRRNEFSNSELVELLKTSSETFHRITKYSKNVILSCDVQSDSYNTTISWNTSKTGVKPIPKPESVSNDSIFEHCLKRLCDGRVHKSEHVTHNLP